MIFGGKDEYGIQTDEVEEFNIKDMKSFPGDWRLPISVSGFSCCVVKGGTLAICGGNTGSTISAAFYLLTFKNNSPTP